MRKPPLLIDSKSCERYISMQSRSQESVHLVTEKIGFFTTNGHSSPWDWIFIMIRGACPPTRFSCTIGRRVGPTKGRFAICTTVGLVDILVVGQISANRLSATGWYNWIRANRSSTIRWSNRMGTVCPSHTIWWFDRSQKLKYAGELHWMRNPSQRTNWRCFFNCDPSRENDERELSQ